MFSSGFIIKQEGVYFICDVKELFNVDLNTPGVKKALNRAFNSSKIPKRSRGIEGITNAYKIPKKFVVRASGSGLIPYDTGLMMSSYTMKPASKTSVICIFDADKILGKVRKGQIVKTYYPAYLYKYPQHRLWVDLLALHFYNNLKIEMTHLKDKYNYDINFDKFNSLWLILLLAYKKLIDEEKKRRKFEEERQKKIEAQRKEFQEKIKNSVNSKQRR